MADDEPLPSKIAERQLGKRKVCGKPHRTRAQAERAMRSAEMWGWHDVRVEERQYYFVVTGYDWGKVPGEGANKSMPGLKGRYRWPGPDQK